MTGSSSKRLTILGIYPYSLFWSMGEGKGAPSFLLAPEGLARAGHRVVLLMLAGDEAPGTTEHKGIELRRSASGPVLILEDATQGRVRRFFRRIRTYLHYRRSMERDALRIGREIRADVVVGYDEYGVPVARAVAQKLGVPNVSRFFGTYMLDHLCNPIRRYYHFVPAIAYRTPAAFWIINNDGSGGDRVAARFGVPADRVRFWRNGIDHTFYCEDQEANRDMRRRILAGLALPPETKLVFTMSRLAREKHVERIIRAMPQTLSTCSETCFLILGEGPERRSLQAEVEDLGLTDSVRFLGAIARTELPNYLNSCDLFVAASDRTNAANPTFEAMLCERPVVLLDTGTTAETIEDGVNGFLVPENQPGLLGAVMARVLADEAMAGAVGRRAREWILANLLSMEDRQAREVDLIERVARGKVVGCPPK